MFLLGHHVTQEKTHRVVDISVFFPRLAGQAGSTASPPHPPGIIVIHTKFPDSYILEIEKNMNLFYNI